MQEYPMEPTPKKLGPGFTKDNQLRLRKWYDYCEIAFKILLKMIWESRTNASAYIYISFFVLMT